MVIEVKTIEEAECIALERYHHLLGNIVSVKSIDFATSADGDESGDDIICSCRVRILKTDERDVVRMMSNDFIDPIYNVEVIDKENYPQLNGFTLFEIFGESIEITGAV